jgi:hypothetical protein
MGLAIDATLLEEPMPMCRRKGHWLLHGLPTVRVRSSTGALDVIEPGVQVRVLVRAANGSEALWVGSIIAVSDDRFALAPWGMADALTFRLSSVVRAGVIPPHTWAERQEVLQRQRRGVPAR